MKKSSSQECRCCHWMLKWIPLIKKSKNNCELSIFLFHRFFRALNFLMFCEKSSNFKKTKIQIVFSEQTASKTDCNIIYGSKIVKMSKLSFLSSKSTQLMHNSDWKGRKVVVRKLSAHKIANLKNSAGTSKLF